MNPNRHQRTFQKRTSIALFGIFVFAFLQASASHAYERAECDQDDKAWLALRACSALLETPGLTKEDRIRFLLRRGDAAVKEDDFDGAVSDFTHVIEADPSNIEALKGRAGAHTKAGNHNAAAADWSALVEKNAEPAQQVANLMERAASWLAAGNSESALADYDQILKTNPKHLKAHVGRGNVFAASGDKEKALAEYDLAQKVDPADWGPYIARAQAAEKWGDTKMAIENYSIIVKGNTRSSAPWRQALKRLGVDTPP